MLTRRVPSLLTVDDVDVPVQPSRRFSEGSKFEKQLSLHHSCRPMTKLYVCDRISGVAMGWTLGRVGKVQGPRVQGPLSSRQNLKKN